MANARRILQKEGRLIMKYQAIVKPDIDALEAAVNQAIAEGWRPSGGLCVVQYETEVSRKGYSETHETFYQAMVHDGQPTEPEKQ